MSITKGSPNLGGQNSSILPVAPATPFTLRDLYVRASLSGNSIATELGRYLNNDETTFSSFFKENSRTCIPRDESDIHERALAAIHEVVISNSHATIDYVSAPEPQGGVQEWWTRMLSGSLNNSKSASGCPAIGESL